MDEDWGWTSAPAKNPAEAAMHMYGTPSKAVPPPAATLLLDFDDLLGAPMAVRAEEVAKPVPSSPATAPARVEPKLHNSRQHIQRGLSGLRQDVEKAVTSLSAVMRDPLLASAGEAAGKALAEDPGFQRWLSTLEALRRLGERWGRVAELHSEKLQGSTAPNEGGATLEAEIRLLVAQWAALSLALATSRSAALRALGDRFSTAVPPMSFSLQHCQLCGMAGDPAADPVLSWEGAPTHRLCMNLWRAHVSPAQSPSQTFSPSPPMSSFSSSISSKAPQTPLNLMDLF